MPASYSWAGKGRGFVGEHDRISGVPIPDHISARHEDLPALLEGLAAFNKVAAQRLDPVLAAAAIAFGFFYIHPFEDGNGRLHRYLIHHVLAERGFNPPGLVFPVSAVILDRINDYRTVLETYSRRLLHHIRCQPTDRGNVDVLNETADFDRYFDATRHAKFLFECVARTIDIDLPAEAAFLRSYNAFRRGVLEIVGRIGSQLSCSSFSARTTARYPGARDKEFAALTDAEAGRTETLFAELKLPIPI